MAGDTGIGAEKRAWRRGSLLRALLLGMGISVLCGPWIKQAEIVVLSSQVTESVPPIPAIIALAVVAALNSLLRKFRPLRPLSLTNAELLMAYSFAAMATSLSGCGIGRFFLALLPAAFYYATPENHFQRLWPYLKWPFFPRNWEAIRGFYEGVEGGKVPWGYWLPVLGVWTAFLFALWLAMFGAISLLRRQWTEHEKLSYPLLQVPVAFVEAREGERPFWLNPYAWGGFLAACFYNALNIANAFNPQVLAPGKFFDLGALFTERPLIGLRPLVLWYRPAIIGLGYFVPLDICASAVLLYFAEKFVNVGAVAVGAEIPGFPYIREQSLGVFLALFGFYLWVARRHLARHFKAAFGAREPGLSREPLHPRTALLFLVGGVLFCLWWYGEAGMSLWLAALYLFLVLSVAVVYARIRAEAGVPLIWMFPWYQHKQFIVNLLGSKRLVHGGDLSDPTLLSATVFLSRGYYSSMMAYQLETVKLGEEGGANPKAVATIVVLSCLVGWWVAFWIHLSAYYEWGAGPLSFREIWGAGLARNEYREVASFLDNPKPPDLARVSATGAGFVLGLVLCVLRWIFPRWPLHPLGFAMATSYGDLIWGPMLLVWVAKALILRLGGVRLYRRLAPLFVGFALGHFFAAGAVWGSLGIWGGEAFKRYAVWFG